MASFVAYIFAYVRKRPSSKAFFALQQVAWQRQRIQQFVEGHGHTVKETVLAFRTSRSRHFADTTEFREAVKKARDLGVAIIVGGVVDLLTRTPVPLFDACAKTLEESGHRGGRHQLGATHPGGIQAALLPS